MVIQDSEPPCLYLLPQASLTRLEEMKFSTLLAYFLVSLSTIPWVAATITYPLDGAVYRAGGTIKVTLSDNAISNNAVLICGGLKVANIPFAATYTVYVPIPIITSGACTLTAEGSTINIQVVSWLEIVSPTPDLKLINSNPFLLVVSAGGIPPTNSGTATLVSSMTYSIPQLNVFNQTYTLNYNGQYNSYQSWNGTTAYLTIATGNYTGPVRVIVTVGSMTKEVTFYLVDDVSSYPPLPL